MPATRQRQDWEDLSALDPYWAILSDPAHRFGGWDREAFLDTGTEAVDAILHQGTRFGLPRAHHDALDFGCGAGRLTRALSRHFDRCLGLDISAQMIEQARAINAQIANCRFAVHDGPDLAELDTDSLDLVLSYLVLQHITQASTKARLIAEFIRVLRPGGLLAFQLPSQIATRHRIQPAPRIYHILRLAGVSRMLLYRRLRLHPMRMSSLKRSRVLALIAAAGGRTLTVREPPPTAGVISSEYFVTKDQ